MTVSIESIKTMFDNATLSNTPLAEIVLDAGTQQRAKINAERVEDYAEAMAQGKANEFPPVKLVELTEAVTMPDGSTLEIGTLVLCDGFHRIDAASKAKLACFQSETVKGALQDAIYYSMTANSQNGVNMQGKDYQNAIRKLYTLEGGYWREHGRKQEIAALFGCSTKTVERAVSAIDKQIKADAFKMFEAGASDSEVAEFAFKSVKTIGEWRAEWEAAKTKNESNDEPKDESNDEPKDEPNSNPLDLTIAQVLQLKNIDLKSKLLKILTDSLAADLKAQAEPQPEAAQDAPWEDEPEHAEGMNDNAEIDELVKAWSGKDWWDVLELDLAQLQALKNPKAAIKRAYNKQLKRCHTDKFGPNKACDILKDVIAEANKMFK